MNRFSGSCVHVQHGKHTVTLMDFMCRGGMLITSRLILQIFADQINVPVFNVVRSRLYNWPCLFYKLREGPLCPFPADPFQQEVGVELATVYVAFPVFVQGFPVPGHSDQTCQEYLWSTPPCHCAARWPLHPKKYYLTYLRDSAVQS